MDEVFSKALGRVIYNESIADITSKTEMNRVVELAGRRPDLEMLLLVCFCLFFVLTIQRITNPGFNSGIEAAIYFSVVITCLTLGYYSYRDFGLAQMMPARDLYALTIDAEEKERIGLPDGLYQIVEVNEDTTSYMIEIWNGGEEHLRALLPKESYHLEKAIDVETDTLADLHTVLAQQQERLSIN
jgi:hypothetical protein